MASSNQERDSHPKPQQSPNHYPYNDVLNPPSPSPSPSPSLSLPLLLPTPNYATYPPHNMCDTMTTIGYPSNIPDNKHDLHAYPQGHVVYIDDKFSSTIYPTKCPPPFLDSNYNPHAYPKGHAIYTENGLTTKYPVGCSKMTPYYGPPPTYHQLTKKDKLLRVFILLCCLFLFAMIIAQFVLIFSGDPDLPAYKVTSMNVTNFITTSSLLSGEWDINISLENPKDIVATYFYNLQVSLSYKGVVLATMKNDSGFNLELEEKKDVQVKSWSNITSENARETYMREGMAKDRMSFGSITFSMEVSAMVKHKSSSLIYNDYQEMHCTHKELKVLFQNENSTTGTIDTSDKKIECRFRIS